MYKKCALLFFMFYTSACLENEVVPLEFEDSGHENTFFKSDYNVIVLPEAKESSLEELHEVGSSEERFGESGGTFQSGLNGTTYKTVKRYHCTVDGHGFLQSRG